MPRSVGLVEHSSLLDEESLLRFQSSASAVNFNFYYELSSRAFLGNFPRRSHRVSPRKLLSQRQKSYDDLLKIQMKRNSLLYDACFLTAVGRFRKRASCNDREEGETITQAVKALTD